MSGYVSALLNPTGNPPLAGTYVPAPAGTDYFVCLAANGSDVTPRYKCFVPNGSNLGLSPGTPGPGTYTVRAYSALVGGTLLLESAPFVVGSAGQTQQPATASFTGGVPSTATVGTAITGITYSGSGIASWRAVRNGTPSSTTALASQSGQFPSYTPADLNPGGTWSLAFQILDANGNVLQTSSTITVQEPAQAAMTGTLSGVPTSGSATVPLTGGTYALQNGTSAFLGLFNVSTGAYQGSLQALSGASGSLPSFTPSAQATYAYKLCSDSAGTNVLFTSPNIAVGAAPVVTLTGLPSSIAAGQPLASTYYTVNGAAYGDFVLYDHTANVEDGPRFTDTVLPDSTFDVLVPQNAGHSYTVRLVSKDGANTVLWESTAFNVTAAPGALPAAVGSVTSSNATTSSVTGSWAAVSGATSYLIQARAGAGQKYGSLVNTTVSSPSYNFTGLSAGAQVLFYVSAINANGRGPAVLAAVYTAAS